MSSKYRVFMYSERGGYVEVEADSPEEAHDLAYEVDQDLIVWDYENTEPSDLGVEEVYDPS